MAPAAAAVARDAAYWTHIGAVLGFLAYIPGSKHRHMFTAIPNIFFRDLGPRGALPAPPPERGQIGISRIEQFSWKDMLDFASCTECGRCQAACPAHAAGQMLSPKLLIMDLRDRLIAADADAADAPLLGGTIREETLWACTTCRACMQVCPLHIEHVPKIVEMRRQLVEEARVGTNLQAALSNLQRSGNSMGKPARQRARWTKDLGFKVKDARKEPVDVLWFVGDYASFDPRAQRVTIALAKLLHAADVDFGILGDAEQNSGNDVRRVGEEGLFALLARSNMDALAASRFNRIMTTDPHSLNALRQEYPALGATYQVHAPHRVAAGAARCRPAAPAAGFGGRGDLSRPVLPRPLQRRLRRAAGADRTRRLSPARDAALPRGQLLLRRRRRAHLGRRYRHRRAAEREPHQGGIVARRCARCSWSPAPRTW